MDTRTLAIVMPVGLAMTEIGLPLPFADFGRSGGYGTSRRRLVDAISHRAWADAQRWFDILVAEGFQDCYDEAKYQSELDGEPPEYASPSRVRLDFITRAMSSPELTDSCKWIARV